MAGQQRGTRDNLHPPPDARFTPMMIGPALGRSLRSCFSYHLFVALDAPILHKRSIYYHFRGISPIFLQIYRILLAYSDFGPSMAKINVVLQDSLWRKGAPLKILHFYSIDGALGRESHLNSLASDWSCSNETRQTGNAAKSSHQTGKAAKSGHQTGNAAKSSHQTGIPAVKISPCTGGAVTIIG
ncbi:hypothetical protein NDS46_01175 [Paenibacillus thiaminolyticus]|uniref:hypothetical protein n=1 Tax=Paenibacillus thiaminolyticus TaxID=49283 RepID=UPI00232D3DE4|nr:hypothetical protein [Paenibacillus thiaminolyticus]WCF08563.1 hypothetical protein NDS46_01175 [Paenibacillus thiaminolyticus]